MLDLVFLIEPFKVNCNELGTVVGKEYHGIP